jgi:hypothetical protein
MYRDVERGAGVLDPILHVIAGGFQLPALTVLSRMTQYADYTGAGVSPLPIMAIAAAVISGFWYFGSSARRPAPQPEATLAARSGSRH